jgi:hypothetical protein
MEENSLKLLHPFICLASGPTGCGKTSFTIDALKHVHPPPEEIFWFYAQDQPSYQGVDANFIHGMPKDLAPFLTRPSRKVIIFDDLMADMTSSKTIEALCTRGSHHCNASVFLLVQNFFARGSCMRTISLQASYLVLFKNPRDTSQVRYIANQMFPTNPAYMIDAFRQATAKPHGYLFVDVTQTTPEHMRLRTDIFDAVQTVFLDGDASLSLRMGTV